MNLFDVIAESRKFGTSIGIREFVCVDLKHLFKNYGIVYYQYHIDGEFSEFSEEFLSHRLVLLLIDLGMETDFTSMYSPNVMNVLPNNEYTLNASVHYQMDKNLICIGTISLKFKCLDKITNFIYIKKISLKEKIDHI
jgi:hypothetical protein